MGGGTDHLGVDLGNQSISMLNYFFLEPFSVQDYQRGEIDVLGATHD